MELLESWGFSGIELNIVRPERVEPESLIDVLSGFGLRMTMFATGATAKAEGLSLSSVDETVRLASVRRCAEFLDYASEYGAGIIVGFLKGGTGAEPARAAQLFKDSLARLDAHARAREVPLLVEATNRYESSVANTLAEAVALVQDLNNPYLRILPDTFHMNIEESNLWGALGRYQGFYDTLHLSDSNRLFPGLGALDFPSILRFLRDMGYSGGVSIEGHVRDSFERDLTASMRLLGPMLSSLEGPAPH
jgi:sugar phosphate isomerase/epimerase